MTSTDTAVTHGFAGILGKELGVAEVRNGSWFTKLVTLYLQFYTSGREDSRERGMTTDERARRVIRRAAAKSALTGIAAAATATGATVLTVQTSGIAGIAALPVAAAGIFGEMLYRALVHIELTCDLADIHGRRFDADDPSDLLRLYSLAFGIRDSKGGALGPARDIIEGVARVSGHDMGQSIGAKLMADGVKRNAVPFMGIVTSGLGNYRRTKQVGETVHRYLRYSGALESSLVEKLSSVGPHGDLLVEGVWFMFSADGNLAEEETAVLAWLLTQVDPSLRAGIIQRFIEDEQEFLGRLREAPQEIRETLYHAFEVAVAVDGATLPERRILRSAARALGRELDPARLAALKRAADARKPVPRA